MNIITSTDGKYIGKYIQDDIQVGDVIVIDAFRMQVQYIRELENNQVCISSPNYQIILRK